MYGSTGLILISLLFSAVGCSIPAATQDPSLVTSLRFAPSAFDSFKQNTELRYTLKTPSKLAVRVVKRESGGKEFIVKTIVEDAAETQGSHAVTWLGDTDGKVFAPAGTYFGRIEIENRLFETAVQVFHY
jgi:flagellar hook assembly protein FlgD